MRLYVNRLENNALDDGTSSTMWSRLLIIAATEKILQRFRINIQYFDSKAWRKALHLALVHPNHPSDAMNNRFGAIGCKLQFDDIPRTDGTARHNEDTASADVLRETVENKLLVLPRNLEISFKPFVTTHYIHCQNPASRRPKTPCRVLCESGRR